MITNIEPESQLKKPFNGIVKEHKKKWEVIFIELIDQKFLYPSLGTELCLSAEMGVCRLTH